MLQKLRWQGVYTRQQLGEDRGILVDRVGGAALGQLAQSGGKGEQGLVDLTALPLTQQLWVNQQPLCTCHVHQMQPGNLHMQPAPLLDQRAERQRTRKDYAFWHQLDEKPSIVPGCPDQQNRHACVTLQDPGYASGILIFAALS